MCSPTRKLHGFDPSADEANAEILQETYLRFLEHLRETSYGEVGFVLTIHDGQILRIKHLHDETFKARPLASEGNIHAGG